ncbi:MAG: hypothetical protein EAZ53_01565 [Bacteroidetes bacterium]|nr:MAG: hypothetical protein EAZ53_01565 [Bacteroidota bacterium]
MKYYNFLFTTIITITLSCSKSTIDSKNQETLKVDAYKNSKIYEISERLDSISFSNGIIVSGSKTTVANDNTILFSDSLLQNNSNVILNIGDEIYIDYVLDGYKHEENNWLIPVFKVSVNKNNKEIKGYLSLKNLIVQKQKLIDGNFILLSIFSDSTSDDMSNLIGSYKVTDYKYKILSDVKIEMIFTANYVDESDKYYFSQELELKYIPNPKLHSVVSIIESKMYYPACGYNSGSHYLIWNGITLQKAFETFELNEAGLFSNYSIVQFPAKRKEYFEANDTILVSNLHKEYEEESKKELVDSTVLAYIWTKDKKIIGPETLFKNK